MIVKNRHPSGSIDEMHESAPSEDPLESCASDLINALEHKDKSLLAQALRNAFDILDSEPHEEGEHLNENDQEE